MVLISHDIEFRLVLEQDYLILFGLAVDWLDGCFEVGIERHELLKEFVHWVLTLGVEQKVKICMQRCD